MTRFRRKGKGPVIIFFDFPQGPLCCRVAKHAFKLAVLGFAIYLLFRESTEQRRDVEIAVHFPATERVSITLYNEEDDSIASFQGRPLSPTLHTIQVPLRNGNYEMVATYSTKTCVRKLQVVSSYNEITTRCD